VRRIDVFNGDADGLCALHQLRLANPLDSELVTGSKRENKLLERVSVSSGDEVTVFDISLDGNRESLSRILDDGAKVLFFDHHYIGAPFSHPALETYVNTAPNVCTSLLVDRYLGGRHRPWAIVGAFGDNLGAVAWTLANEAGLDITRIAQLSELGECLNYNAYGESVQDLFFHPADLYLSLKPFDDPFAFIAESPVLGTLRAGFWDDWSRARSIAPAETKGNGAAYILPNEPWARRIAGVFANRLAAEAPATAYAILVRGSEDVYSVSVRAPILNPEGADELCHCFETGGGRKGAAGVSKLPIQDLDRFLVEFFARFG
jgi:hypothetical protein